MSRNIVLLEKCFMKDFSFVALTYNHEKYIIEHLESVKNVVKTYGKQVDTKLLICDDCSRDDTVKKCKNWIVDNEYLFSDIRIIENDKNVGIVKNYINAINNVESEDFKILAGDDKYELFDIYKTYAELRGNILITHMSAFGENNREIVRGIDVNFYFLKEMNEKGKLRELLLVDNFISAPAVFVPGKYLKDEDLHVYLSDYKYIEDYPQWFFLLVKKKLSVIVKDEKYIKYRIGTGISTSKNHQFNDRFADELRYMRKTLKCKNHILPKYINPYRYWIRYKRIVLQRKYSI